MPATFLLGTHQPGWLTKARVPLFVSDVRLRVYKTLPRAAAPWSLDSGGFSELQYHGQWTSTPEQYADRVRRYRDDIGLMRWCAPMDWMCEEAVIKGGWYGPLYFVGTGLSVVEHQHRTVENLAQLRQLAPDLPFIPVIQGYTQAEYEHCVTLYQAAGIDLTTEPLVGLGSVCRRQATKEAHEIVNALRRHGITRLHGFGVKTLGLQRYGHLLASADSLAWSYDARKLRRRMPGCDGRHKNCANCLRYAVDWRTTQLATLAR